jgi:hypothetical protein
MGDPKVLSFESFAKFWKVLGVTDVGMKDLTPKFALCTPVAPGGDVVQAIGPFDAQGAGHGGWVGVEGRLLGLCGWVY